jgi:hypothetical protein
MKLPFLVALFLIIGLLPAGTFASEYRCEGKIVSVGDTSGELLMKCGEPDWKQSHDEEIIEAWDKDSRHRIIITVEEWTYNLGPDRFMRIFRLQNGKVVDILLGGYGFAKEETNQLQCNAQNIAVGDSAIEVLAKCGEPVSENEWEEMTSERLDDGTVRKVNITVAEWTYNLGPDKFIRIITLRNGTVVNIQSGGRGSEMK